MTKRSKPRSKSAGKAVAVKNPIAEVEKVKYPYTGPVKTMGSTRRSIGSSGVVISNGYIADNERNSTVAGENKWKTYSDILANVSIVAAGTRHFLNLISRAQWRVEPSDNSAEAVKIAELIEKNLYDMETSWPMIVRRGAMYRFLGFSVQEWRTKKDAEGNIIFADISPRPQSTITRWDLDDNGSVIGIIQRDPNTSQEIYLPRTKCIYVTDNAISDSPEGLGLFRHLVRGAYQLERLEELEGYGYETDLRGVPIGKAPISLINKLVEDGEITESDKAAMLLPLTTFIREHIKTPDLGLIMDSEPHRSEDETGMPISEPHWSLDLLKSDATGFKDIGVAINRKCLELARVLNVEGLLLGSGDGSHALSQDKSMSLSLVVEAVLNDLVHAHRRDTAARILELNGYDKKYLPTIKVSGVRYRDVEEITAALNSMALSGAVLDPTDPAIDEVRAILGISKHVPYYPEVNTQDSSTPTDGGTK